MNQKKIFYLLCFVEGATVMAVELIGAKLLSPHYGSSLYVWASVLAITLGGLALGYYQGGVLSEKKKVEDLYLTFINAASFVVLMPLVAHFLIEDIHSFPLLLAILISTLVVLLPSVYYMGKVFPMIINLLIENTSEAGKVSGSIYALSTVGGIISTLLTGFFIIPTFGLTVPLFFFGILLAGIPLVKLLQLKKYRSLSFILFLCIGIAYHFLQEKEFENVTVLYKEEGLMGQIMVSDMYNSKDSMNNRSLLINHIVESVHYQSATDTTFPDYINLMGEIAGQQKNKNSALMIGLGSGALANQLQQLGYKVDACEIDQRIYEAATNYFNLSEKVIVTIDDGRHFINNCTQKYDFIASDVYKGEVIPNHIITKESLVKIKEMLSESGLLMINGTGFFLGEKGKGMRAIYHTLKASGLYVKIHKTHSNPAYSNTIFVASKNKESLPKNISYLATIEVDKEPNKIILSDEFPILELLNARSSLEWRKAYASNFKHFYVKKK